MIRRFVPIYLITGFIESGKTTLGLTVLGNERFTNGGKVLILCCEEGEVEWDRKSLEKYKGDTASMAAQIVAPILSGALYDLIGMRAVFFAFGTVFVALSFVTMFFVKHGDSKPEVKGALESLDTED